MNTELNKRLLDESIRIADEMYEKRKEDEYGIYWETMDFDHISRSINWKYNESIYSGVSGIILFYLEIYKITGNHKYLNICKSAAERLIVSVNKNDDNNFFFLTGRMSVAFLFMKLDKYIQGNYLNEALKIAESINDSYIESKHPYEYLNGISGTILSLLHLHSETKKEFLINLIDKLVKVLLNNFYYNGDGLHWDRSSNYMKSLCGFSHGASGIAFVFLELGNYLKNEVFYYLAEQLFKYESNYYSNIHKNWMDMRNSFYDDYTYNEHRTAFLNDNKTFFTVGDYFSAWCHGAPGIGLSRARAAELLKKRLYKKELGICINNVKRNASFGKKTTFNMCHGLSGNLDLLLYSGNKFKNIRDSKYLFDIAEKMLINHEKEGIYLSGLHMFAGEKEDYSFFLGNSGIGYFYLSLLTNEISYESMLTPEIIKINTKKINKLKYNALSLTVNEMREKIIKIVFPETFNFLKITSKKKLNNYLRSPEKDYRNNEIKKFCKFVREIIKNKKAKDIEKLKDVFGLEKKLLDIDNKIKSYSFMNAITLFNKDIYINLINNDELLLKSEFKLNENICLYKTKWNWVDDITSYKLKENEKMKSKYLFLLIAQYNKIIINNISLFSYELINLFKKKRKIGEALEIVVKLFNTKTEEQRQEINIKVINQIKYLVRENILLLNNK